jgi:predicted XRE-type DNA-binding protein
MEEVKSEITYGSGNVFADLGFANAEEHLAKAKLVHAISLAVKTRNLTQAEAAQLLGVDQPKVSKLLRGQFRGFSSDRLLHMLNQLGQDVMITIVSSPTAENRHGHISVAISQPL